MTLRLRPTPSSPVRLARRLTLQNNAAIVQAASIASVASADVGELNDAIAEVNALIDTVNTTLTDINTRLEDVEAALP